MQENYTGSGRDSKLTFDSSNPLQNGNMRRVGELENPAPPDELYCDTSLSIAVALDASQLVVETIPSVDEIYRDISLSTTLDSNSNCSSSPEPPEEWTQKYSIALAEQVNKNGANVTFTVIVRQDDVTVSGRLCYITFFKSFFFFFIF